MVIGWASAKNNMTVADGAFEYVVASSEFGVLPGCGEALRAVLSCTVLLYVEGMRFHYVS